MNRNLLVVCLVAGAFLLPAIAGAAVNGPCVQCHTMHDSQDGAAVNAGGPQDNLLRGTGCVGCHATGAGNGAATGVAAAAPNAPQVDDATNTNSAGYFSKGPGADANEHQVADFTAELADTAMAGLTAPGGTFAVGAAAASPNLGCATCHTRSAHHNTPANTYRMLGNDFNMAVQTESLTYGVRADAAAGIGNTSATKYDATAMNIVCAGCHGTFHTAQAGSAAGLWERHPTDIQVVNNVNQPSIVALTDAADTDEVTVGDDGATANIVMCITCHNAHGSSMADLLKYSYAANVAGDATVSTGCETCHSYGTGM